MTLGTANPVKSSDVDWTTVRVIAARRKDTPKQHNLRVGFFGTVWQGEDLGEVVGGEAF